MGFRPAPDFRAEAEIDDAMRRAVDERLRARLAANREHRDNRRRRLTELSDRRRHVLDARHRTKLARHQKDDQT